MQADERAGQVIDGIVRRGNGAVAPGIQGFELEVDVNFFAGLNGRKNRFPILFFEFAPVQVDAILRIDPVAVRLQQPVDAVGRAALFVGGQRQNQVAVRHEALFLQANKVGDQDGVTFFHVFGASAVEIAVFFEKCEGIGSPVLAKRLDNIEMADKQDRFALPGASKAHHEILFAVARPGNVKIIFGKPCVAKSLGHGFGGGGYVAHGVGGVDLDELLKNVTRHLIGGTQILCPGPGNETANPAEHHHRKNRFVHQFSLERKSGKRQRALPWPGIYREREAQATRKMRSRPEQ